MPPEDSEMGTPQLPVVEERGGPDADDDMEIVIIEEPGAPRDYDAIDAAIEKAMAEDLVIKADRIGGAPYFRHTPYRNHHGTLIHMWSCISLSFRAMPERTLLTYPTLIDPRDSENYAVDTFTTEWMRDMLRHSRYIYLYEPEASPFGGDLFQWEVTSDE